MKLNVKIALLPCLFLGIADGVYAQSKVPVDGWVYDAQTLDPLPYANLVLSAGKSGTITAPDGSFSFQSVRLPDTLKVSTIGYYSVSIVLTKQEHEGLKVALRPKEFEINEVVVRPGENPAFRIIRNAISARDDNNPMKATNYACNTYTKIMINALGDNEKYDQGKIAGLPVYFSERLSQNIYQKAPFIEKGKVLASKQEGLGFLSEMNVVGYENNMSVDVNFYENNIEIMDKPFVGPLSNRAFFFYKFFLADSVQTEFGKEYLIEYKPKNIYDLAFSGHLKITDDTWGLTEVVAKVPVTANLNYVNKLEFRQTFVPVNDSLTFFKTNETTAELKLTKDNAMLDIDFAGRMYKRSVYSGVMVDFQPIQPGGEEEVWAQINLVPKTMKAKDVVASLRPEKLTEKEKQALLIIDSLNNNWKIKSADALSRMFITGYIPGDYIELGPFLELVKNNKIESLRYTFSARTSANFTKNVMLYGHIGYGTRDEDWKYGAGISYKLPRKNRRVFNVEYRDDLSKIGDNGSIFLIKENMMVTGEDNVIAAILTNDPLDKLSREIRYSANYEHEWRQGVTAFATIKHRTIYSGQYLPFIQSELPAGRFQVNEAMLGLRLSWKENYSDNYCRRFYLSTAYPIVHLRFTVGQYHLMGKTKEFCTVRGVINHDVNWGQTKLEYVGEAGATFGTVPFPLLEIHRTDPSLGYALYSFNMMNEMEFVSDRFVSLMAQYHLNGLVLNRVPLLKHMGFREVVSVKLLWSHLGNKHQESLVYPGVLYSAPVYPYAEVSTGLENLFQYFRLDLVWRLNYLDNPGVTAMGIRARFDVNF